MAVMSTQTNFLMSCSDTAVIYLLWRREKNPTWTSEVWFILNGNKETYQSEQIQLHASTRLQTCYNQATEDNQAEWNITLHGARIWSANTILIKPRLCASLISVTQSIGMKNLKAKQLPSISSSWSFLRLFRAGTTGTSVSKRLKAAFLRVWHCLQNKGRDSEARPIN